MNRRALLAVPLGIAAAGGAAFYAMLDGMKAGTFDPRGVPSMLIGKPVPDFTLAGPDANGSGANSPGANGSGANGPAGSGFTSRDLAAGYPVVVNFFASWCEPCVLEAPVLMALKQGGVPLYGIAYKDKPAATATYLQRHGNPYARLARDEPGRVAIDWGVTGVPESYLIDGRGIVRWRFVGPMGDQMTAALPGLIQKYA